MRVFLIRHGETVDNLAGLYAGSKDSSLTNHGYLQATRLAEHFKVQGIVLSAMFCSQLQRARKTAELIIEAQPASGGLRDGQASRMNCLPILAEKDFGSFEGKSFIPRPENSPKRKTIGKPAKQAEFELDTDFKAPEAKEAMAARMNTFLDKHLLPLANAASEEGHQRVAIVSHALIMSALWRQILLRVPTQNVVVDHGVSASREYYTLDRLPTWSNTGYLELELSFQSASRTDLSLDISSGRSAGNDGSSKAASQHIEDETPAKADHLPCLQGVHVIAVNKTEHLKGFKRTGGGVGSAKYDAGQRSIETFFKKRKVN